MKVISYVIIVTLIASVLVNAQAFATSQPYVAGYTNSTQLPPLLHSVLRLPIYPGSLQMILEWTCFM